MEKFRIVKKKREYLVDKNLICEVLERLEGKKIKENSIRKFIRKYGLDDEIFLNSIR